MCAKNVPSAFFLQALLSKVAKEEEHTTICKKEEIPPSNVQKVFTQQGNNP